MMQGDLNGWEYFNGLIPFVDCAALRRARPTHLTREEFLKRLPQFADVPDDLIDDLLELSRVQFNRLLWGGFLKWGELAFVAHFLQLRKDALDAAGDDETGMVLGRTVTGINTFNAGSVSYTRNSAIDEKIMASPFAATTWGLWLLAMQKRIAVGLVMVT
jgi:hypothetical protein